MLSVIILAAGKGTRMGSRLPKVLQPLGGRPLLHHVIATSQSLAVRQTLVVVGYGKEAVQNACAALPVSWAVQSQQLGTGHAVMQAMSQVVDDDIVIILYGDVPLIQASTLARLVDLVDDDHPLALLTVHLPDPAGYGRIVRDEQGQIVQIVEQQDATADERAIREVNTGIMAVRAVKLRHWLSRLKNDNAQGEYYLTDIIALAVSDGYLVRSVEASSVMEVMGVNDRLQLAELERLYQREQARALMYKGVTLLDPSRLDIRGTVEVGMDVLIDINVVLSGRVVIGDGVSIGAGCVLHNVTLGDGVYIAPYSVLEDCVIGDQSRIGPFARIRPGTVTEEDAHIGNFVELKNARLASGVKVNHLSYIGDAEVGARCNIGAGTITCNYDGANKHRTVIGEQAFIGSNSALVAPVVIGAGATIGAGSVVTKEAPEGQLTLARARQVTIKGWQRPTKDNK